MRDALASGSRVVRAPQDAGERDQHQAHGPGARDGVIVGANPFFQGSFTWRNRVARGAWNFVQALLFRPSPRPLHAWRRLLLRLFGARLGRHSNVYPGAKIWAPWNLETGDFVGIADGAILYNMAPVRLGDYSTVSAGAHLCGGTHDPDSAVFQLVTGPIELGPYSWVCAEAFVGPGVRIPEGAVIGARSVVMRSPEGEWTIYAGVPCRALRPRARRMKEHLQRSGALAPAPKG